MEDEREMGLWARSSEPRKVVGVITQARRVQVRAVGRLCGWRGRQGSEGFLEAESLLLLAASVKS